MAESGMQKFWSTVIELSADTAGMKKETNLEHMSEKDISLVIQLFIEAERIIDLLLKRVLTFGKLDERRRDVLAFYFYLTNPLMNRIVDLHTRLPLATLTLQKPSDANEIIQDYVYNFFEKMLNRCGWKKAIYKAVVYYWIFSKALILTEDDFNYDCEVDADPKILENEYKKISEDDKKKISEIVKNYITKGTEYVSKEDLDFVIKSCMPNYNPNFKGIKNMRVISPLDVEEQRYNDEIDLNIYKLNKSEFIKKYLAKAGINDQGELNIDVAKGELEAEGYSKSFIEVNTNADNPGEFYEVSNRPFDTGIYMLELQKGDVGNVNFGLILPVLADLLKYYDCQQKEFDILTLAHKKINIMATDAEVSLDQMNNLKYDMLQAIQNSEGSLVAVNFPVTVEEAVLDVREKLQSVLDLKKDAQTNISLGSGMPESLVTAQDTYGGSYLKLEVLNSEYLAFRQILTEFIEEKIFKQIAIKRGFITVDIYGNVKPIIPKVRFEAGTIIGTSEFKDLLKDLASENILPKSKFLQYIGFDPEEVIRERLQEKKLMKESGLEEDEGRI